MQISIKNLIKMGEEMEHIYESYPVELTIKGEYYYLVYVNDAKEKVVLKFNATELVMTRFSTPQSTMRFVAGSAGLCSIPTPLGVQKLVSQTDTYHISDGKLALAYALLPGIEAKEALANYHMEITWE